MVQRRNSTGKERKIRRFGIHDSLRKFPSGFCRCEKRAFQKDSTDATAHSASSFEYNAAIGHYLRLSGHTAEKVGQVDLYKSPATERQFLQKKEEFATRGVSTLELWCYHGTKENNIQDIMTFGFKVGGCGVAIANGAAYGRGVYAATGPKTPENYAGTSNKVILSRAIVGNLGQSECDSCDAWKPKADWIVFRHPAQLLPVYVVHINQSEKSISASNHLPCPHCQTANASKKGNTNKDGAYKCCSCHRAFQQLDCPYCTKSIVWKNVDYKEGKKIACPYAACGKSFVHVSCPSCSLGNFWVNGNNYVPVQQHNCWSCQTSFQQVNCPTCSKSMTWKKADYLEGNETQCLSPSCGEKFAAVACPHCYLTNYWKNGNKYIPGKKYSCYSCRKKFQQLNCPCCFGSILWKNANYIEGRKTQCPYPLCRKKFTAVVCLHCSVITFVENKWYLPGWRYSCDSCHNKKS